VQRACICFADGETTARPRCFCAAISRCFIALLLRRYIALLLRRYIALLLCPCFVEIGVKFQK
jgi:hypothetical protein